MEFILSLPKDKGQAPDSSTARFTLRFDRVSSYNFMHEDEWKRADEDNSFNCNWGISRGIAGMGFNIWT